MHSAALILFNFAGFMDYVHEHLPIAVVAIAIALAPSLQLIKRYVPNLNGWAAMLANFLLAVLAVFAVTPAGDFWTIAAWMHVLQVSGIAAGIHGTATKLAQNASATDNPTPSGTPAQQNFTSRPILAALLAVVALGMTGCVHQPTGSTPSAPAATPYQRAATVMSNFASDLQSAQQITDKLYLGGAIDKPSHTTIQGFYNQVATYGIQIDALIGAQAASATIADKVTAGLTSLDSIIGASGKLDPATSSQITAAINLLKQLLQSVLTYFVPGVSAVTTQPVYLEAYLGPRTYRNTRRAGIGVGLQDLSAGENFRRANEISRRYPRVGRCIVRTGAGRQPAVVLA